MRMFFFFLFVFFFFFSYFAQKVGYNSSCKFSPDETICMKCQIPVVRSNSNCCLLNFLLDMLSLNNKKIARGM